LRQTQQLKKRIRRDPTKRESKRFHSTWVEQKMPATEDMVEMVGGMAVAMEAVVEALWLPCLARHWSKGHAKTSKATSSPLALETKARKETCSGPLKRRRPPTFEPSLVTMRLKSGLLRSKSHSRSQPNPNPFWIGMVRESRPPRTKLLSSLPV
jgi:hypothetical protein